ncbi:unnamed protein product [Urochloa decumbens]|uniref:DUF674 family protein n=1 Tax=Urochloa decumbens TaxID=240449 RepID=A0ABC9AFR2_9POAL
MAMATTAVPLSMKLLIDTRAQRVLSAEASKEVVDFLFSLLALPVATAVKLVGKDAMVGCVGNLYASVDKLDATYVLPGAAKDALLSPTVLSPAASSANSSLLRLPAAVAPSTGLPKSYFKCSNNYSSAAGFGSSAYTSSCSIYVTDASGTICPNCGGHMKMALQYAAPSPTGQTASAAGGAAAKGFVQGIVTYTVLDNLTVTPMSAISGITLLNAFAVRDLADLQERTVQLGYNEGLAILKASLQSKAVLSDVFLGNKKALGPGGRE